MMNEPVDCPECGKTLTRRGLGSHRRGAHGYRGRSHRRGHPGATIVGEERERIVAMLHEGLSRQEICRRTGRGASTITGIARDEGIEFAQRSQVAAATEARKIDLAARRAELAQEILDEAVATLGKIRARRHKRILKAAQGAEYVRELDFVPPDDLKTLSLALGALVDRHLKLDAHDSDEHGLAAVDQWLKGMIGD